ncbi:VOC family protein [Bryobacter aggregatus]|uniref:VOC family protein n=1 Tax=Bryobacter aggregatus TaxID=360054 RepID=UPI000689760F|nr:VOC family protein [Bryobacter aggregatus]
MRIIGLVLALGLACSAAELKRPKITGVAHIALYVSDMEKAREYYHGLLGFSEPYSLQNPDGSLSMTFFKVNDRQYIELFPEKKANTDRLNHISVETDDIEGMRNYLASKGVAVPEKVGIGRIKNKNFNVKDPDGNTIEFVQYEPDGWSMREKGKLQARGVSSHIMHVGVIVTALEPSMRFYRDLLGFQEFWRGSKDEKVLSWVNLRVPDGEDYIELMLYAQKPEETKRGSAHHLCLAVPDIKQALAVLETLPARKNYTRPLEIRTGINRRRQLNLFDPDGTRAELMETKTVDGHDPLWSKALAP